MPVKEPQAIQITPEQFDTLGRYELTDHLERSRVVIFPTPPLELPSDEDLRFLKEQTPEYHTSKNISYYPQARQVRGIKAPRDIEQRTQTILMEYQDSVEACLKRLIPSFTEGWTSATSSHGAGPGRLICQGRSGLSRIDQAGIGRTAINR